MDVEAINLIPHASFALSRTSLSLLTLLAAHLKQETALRSFARKLQFSKMVVDLCFSLDNKLPADGEGGGGSGASSPSRMLPYLTHC